MKNLLNKIWNKEEGFTLIELIIVIAILAIIAAIAIPNVLSAVDNSRKTTDVSNAKIIADAAATVRAKNDDFSGETGVFQVTGAGNDIENVYVDAVANQLNNVPALRYQGTDIDEVNFVFSVASNGTIEVYASPDGTTAAGLMLYPTPDTAYAND